MYWYEKENHATSPVISVRVRFARNLEDCPFPHRLSAEERVQVWERIREAFREKELVEADFSRIGELEKRVYVQTHLASPVLAEKGAGTGLLLSRDGALSIMVNEEDHLRLQVIMGGDAVNEAFDLATEYLRHASARLPFAFRQGLGYLTSCPTNLGAAMRLSAMVHLPVLTRTGRIRSLSDRLQKSGFTVRGLFGEGSEAIGEIYQISNQNSREMTPEEIHDAFVRMLAQVIRWETQQDASLGDEAEDRFYRAWGQSLWARKLSWREFALWYSDLRLGRRLGIPEAASLTWLDRYLIQSMPAPMELSDLTLADSEKRDRERARRLREMLREKEE